MTTHIFQKNIFIVWYQTDISSIKQIYLDNIKNWQVLNPDWKVKLLDQNDLRNACKKFSDTCVETYDSFNLMHLKIDLGRYAHLYLYGGIYVDIDCYAFRSLDTSKYINSLVNEYNKTNKSFLGLSTVNLNTLESLVFTFNSITINNAIMMSNKGNLVLKKLINSVSNNGLYSNFNQIQYTTGPIFINNFFNKTHTESTVVLFPHTVFEPTPPLGNDCYSDITDDTIAIHQFTMSWISPELQTLINLYNNIKPFIIPAIVLFIFNRKCVKTSTSFECL